MNYASIKEIDIANGPGIRTSLFVSGCRHACQGCFNKEIWDFNSGKVFNEETIQCILSLVKKDFVKGLTLLGGEPLDPMNQEWVYKLIMACRTECPNKSIWCYTGYTYEYVIENMVDALPYTKNILSLIDVLVDGKYVENLKNLKLQFRGSANQRVIDLRETDRQKKIIWALSEEEQNKYVSDKIHILKDE